MENEARFGTTTVNDKTATAIRYERIDGAAGSTYNVQFLLGPDEVARAAGVKPEALQLTVGERNAQAITGDEKGVGALVGPSLASETGLTPEERELRRLDPERDTYDGSATNVIEAVPEAQRNTDATEAVLADIDVDEALAAAKRLRAIDRQSTQQAEVQQALGDAADTKRVKVGELDGKSRRLDRVNDLAESAGTPNDREDQWRAERDKNRQVELMDQLHSQYRVSGNKFHFKDQPGKLAFKDKGAAVISASNDERVARAMATMAEAKGWKTIKVSGHPDFQREVWMEASLRGLQVRGYTPDERDRKALDDRLDNAMRNSIEPHDHDKAREQARLVKSREAAPDAATARTEAPEASKAPRSAPAGKEATGERRNAAGVVLEHGPAPYRNDPKAALNYFVKLATEKGERVVWGLDLQRAMAEGGAAKGDKVQLSYLGSRQVTIQQPVHDEAGKVIGHKDVDAVRNEWRAEKTDRHRAVEAVAGAMAAAAIRDPAAREAFTHAVAGQLDRMAAAGKVPTVSVYDRAAPAPNSEADRARPAVERNAERTR